MKLYRIRKLWVVVEAKNSPDPQVFDSIEQAADFLEKQGVHDEEIDAALVDMAAKYTTCAKFGELNGTFLFSDHSTLKLSQ